MIIIAAVAGFFFIKKTFAVHQMYDDIITDKSGHRAVSADEGHLELC